jgi:photosystem II stability/assembly factor-like uncharacterized protein
LISLKCLPVVFLLSLSLCRLFSQVETGWQWSNPYPQGHHLTSVEYLSASTIVAVGWNGSIIRTSNGGVNWSFYRYNTLRDFRKVQFVNQNIGYAVGDSSLMLKTTDGGISWTRLNYYSSNHLLDLHFVDEATGYVTMISGLLKTTNGGSNFNQLVIPGYSGWYVHFVDEVTGYSGNSKVFKTTNSGANWVELATIQGYECNFVNNNTGFLSGSGIIHRTTNGGVNWQSVSVPNNSLNLNIKFVDEITGYAAGNSYIIIKTTNAGLNWFSISTNQSILNYNDINLLGQQNVVSVGQVGMITISSNSGNNWQEPIFQFRSELSEISFPNLNTGFVTGEVFPGESGLHKTTNQGISWFGVPSSLSDFNSSLKFIDINTGFVGNSNGEIYKTTNSGTNWTVYNTSENGFIFDLEFINNTTGFCCGVLSSVYKTTNAGVNWIRVNYLSNGNYLLDIHFPVSDIGYIAGDGQLLKSTNTGVNWVQLNTPPNSSTNFSIHFINQNTGFLGGSSGIVSKTTNGGINWTTVVTVSPYRISKIQFEDNNTGYLCGGLNANGDNLALFMNTTNGGLDWNRQNLPANYRLYDMCFVNLNTGFLVGEAGTILKTTSGGAVIGISNPNLEVVDKFILSGNYPNPFNPGTRIAFELPKRSKVKLEILDILGKHVATIVDQYLESGRYDIDWDASNYASGVYFYRIEAEEPNGKKFVDSKKMVLLK